MATFKIKSVRFDVDDLSEKELNELIENSLGEIYVVDDEEDLVDAVSDHTGFCISQIDYEQIPSVDVRVYGLYCGETNTTEKSFELPIFGKKTDLAVVRAVKSALGWNGIHCKKQEDGDTIRLDPSGLLQCAVIEVIY
jgi:hypothetical protein